MDSFETGDIVAVMDSQGEMRFLGEVTEFESAGGSEGEVKTLDGNVHRVPLEAMRPLTDAEGEAYWARRYAR